MKNKNFIYFIIIDSFKIILLKLNSKIYNFQYFHIDSFDIKCNTYINS